MEINIPLVSVGVFSDEGTPLESSGAIPATGISRLRISHIGNVFSSLPDDFEEHRGWQRCGRTPDNGHSEYRDAIEKPLYKGHTFRSLHYYTGIYILTFKERTASL